MTAKENITSIKRAPIQPREELFPEVEDATTLTVGVPAMLYSASSIARAVEDCDANLLNLNITRDGAMPRQYSSDEVIVELRVDVLHSMAVVRSLERYGYRVISAKSPEGHELLDPAGDHSAVVDVIDETLRDRVNLLLRLID